ncbi:MAG: hypothetical protein K5695_10990 [Oscillospiraceae bacterium]|nr:hypothetical protein [Oscillospiraceae bacterium]
MDMKKYLEGLSPALQEKAKACKTPAELLKLADENDIELQPEALEAVSGGCGGSDSGSSQNVCPYCGSKKIFFSMNRYNDEMYYTCSDCQETYDRFTE